MPLYDILNEFQKGHSHIAAVYKELNETNGRTMDGIGVGRQPEVKDVHALTKNDGVQRVKKVPGTTTFKRHKGCSFCILDVENAPIPEFPPNQVVVGVITMEDVIEELLKEEILDETDEYVNIHNRIKVNMNASYERLPAINPTQPSPDTSSIVYGTDGATIASTGFSSTAESTSPVTKDQASEGNVSGER